jgi:aspartyl-tRNA(Asn)/glutamyl-tRNA(Gln) amidotransferase subunit A
MKSKILELHNKLLNNQTTIAEIVGYSIDLCKANINLNAIITDNFVNAEQLSKSIKFDKDNLLSAIPYTLKDLFSTKDIRTTGGSKFLQNYIPCYSASIYEKLNQLNCVLIAKSNCDEFGMGGTGLYSAYGHVLNSINNDNITGGSSSGDAANVASGVVPFALGTDTGDSVRAPASLCGIVGYKPSYGLISRYGVFSYSPSLDHVGIMTKYVTDAAIVAQSLIFHDSKDYTSQQINAKVYDNLKTENNITLGLIKNIDISDSAKDIYNKTIDILKQSGIKFIEFDFNSKLFSSIKNVYKIISYVEGSTCYEFLQGILLGKTYSDNNYTQLINESRTNGIGEQVKKRFSIGNYISNKDNFELLFTKAQKVRTLLNNETNKILSSCDGLLLPSHNFTEIKIQDILNNSIKKHNGVDALQLGNFAGLPSITIPTNSKSEPFGINIMCKQFDDQKMFNIALTIEEILGGEHE